MAYKRGEIILSLDFSKLNFWCSFNSACQLINMLTKALPPVIWKIKTMKIACNLFELRYEDATHGKQDV